MVLHVKPRIFHTSTPQSRRGSGVLMHLHKTPPMKRAGVAEIALRAKSKHFSRTALILYDV
ncbi:hypothetical protein EXT67_05475 [Pectobacterium atrosepticum]|nr:hypothetical protein CVS35_11835 [Pectobacterium atrosepticum]MCL6315816.1 hypothetical protein [Pectobacterium atrosepticum]MCL6319948.1 hypothetical protein [Pectobacterium atrosepticum]MCL6390178.1 hypothetical protein [Pectobacterium atrosepticum]PWD67393.1 hypothetical protein DF214_00730 [Pectobacterium atrosepticum]